MLIEFLPETMRTTALPTVEGGYRGGHRISLNLLKSPIKWFYCWSLPPVLSQNWPQNWSNCVAPHHHHHHQFHIPAEYAHASNLVVKPMRKSMVKLVSIFNGDACQFSWRWSKFQTYQCNLLSPTEKKLNAQRDTNVDNETRMTQNNKRHSVFGNVEVLI